MDLRTRQASSTSTDSPPDRVSAPHGISRLAAASKVRSLGRSCGHPLAAAAEEAGETGTERAGAFDRERSPARRVPVDELQSLRVAVAASDDRRLENDHAAHDLHDRERMRIAVRIDTDHVVQLICKHPRDLRP
jgi:hypothetical protein